MAIQRFLIEILCLISRSLIFFKLSFDIMLWINKLVFIPIVISKKLATFINQGPLLEVSFSMPKEWSLNQNHFCGFLASESSGADF